MSIIYILSILLVFLNYNNINNMLYQITHLDHPVVIVVLFCKMEVKVRNENPQVPYNSYQTIP